MEFIKAFIVGGIICVIGQILIDLTKLTPARIMVLFVVAGVVLGILGIYPMLVEWGEPELPYLLSGLEMSLQKELSKMLIKWAC